jgi:hypothetical protein
MHLKVSQLHVDLLDAPFSQLFLGGIDPPDDLGA